jgi:hypothetical protein
VWRLRTGAGLWLGAIRPQYLDPEPAPIRPSPLSWLQHRCTGLVPLSRNPFEIWRVQAWCRRVQLRDNLEARRAA